jgi:peptide/nickel transport system permease protein
MSAATAVPVSESRWRAFAREYAKAPGAIAALAVLAAILFVAAAAPLISPQDPYDLRQLDIMDNLQPPGSRSFAGMLFALGTDGQGRDILSAIFFGLRTSLIVGVASGVLALHDHQRDDDLVGAVAEHDQVLLVVLGNGADKIIIALVIVQWAFFARTVRGVALVENARDYMEAARCLRLPRVRMLFTHLLPNCMPTLLVVGTVQVASAISLEATLSFLGLGLPPTEPSLGLLIANGFRYMMSGNWWVSVFPGLALLATIMSINVIGDRLRDVLNPRLRH